MKKILVPLILLIVVAVAALAGVSYWMKSSLTTPKEHDKAGQYIVIEKGTSPGEIVAKLEREGIISSATPLNIYLRTLSDGSKLKAGEYRFASPVTPMQVLAQLEKGEERVTRIVIPEGFTKFDIARRIVEFIDKNPKGDGAVSDRSDSAAQSPPDEKQVLALMNDTSLIRELAPEAKNLEGYMYPSTYDLEPDATAEEIVKTMVNQFRRIWKPEWTKLARAIGRTPHEIVTIASLIETETGVPTERPIVASVIYNRLSKGVPLGIDQTAVYIAKMEGRWDGTINRSDLDSTSPYNTRKYSGIPPGPISSVSESSIVAALNPATTDYIYYVRNVQANDGSHWFYASASDFERGKTEYQRWLEKERQEMRENDARPK